MQNQTRPICKMCASQGLKYTVQAPMSGTTTLMAYVPGYWDEEGIYQETHNPNTITYRYSCNNGHYWTSTDRYGR